MASAQVDLDKGLVRRAGCGLLGLAEQLRHGVHDLVLLHTARGLVRNARVKLVAHADPLAVLLGVAQRKGLHHGHGCVAERAGHVDAGIAGGAKRVFQNGALGRVGREVLRPNGHVYQHKVVVKAKGAARVRGRLHAAAHVGNHNVVGGKLALADAGHGKQAHRDGRDNRHQRHGNRVRAHVGNGTSKESLLGGGGGGVGIGLWRRHRTSERLGKLLLAALCRRGVGDDVGAGGGLCPLQLVCHLGSSRVLFPQCYGTRLWSL